MSFSMTFRVLTTMIIVITLSECRLVPPLFLVFFVVSRATIMARGRTCRSTKMRRTADLSSCLT